MANRPDFIQIAEYRRKCLGELTYLRELRHESKQRLLALASHTSRSNGGSAASVNTGPLFSPPLGKINTLICLLFQKPKCNDFLMLSHIYIYMFPVFSTVHSTLCTAYSKLCALFIACYTHIINSYISFT